MLSKVTNKFYIVCLLTLVISCSAEDPSAELPRYVSDDVCRYPVESLITSYMDRSSGCPLPGSDYEIFDDWYNNGQFDYKGTFFGYRMMYLRGVGEEVGEECRLNSSIGCMTRLFVGIIGGAGLSSMDHKLASINNLKSDLRVVCGENWESLRMTGYPQVSSATHICEFAEVVPSDGYAYSGFTINF